jgi:uncharacterized protein (TIGR00369 family)
MNQNTDNAARIASEGFAQLLGVQLIDAGDNRAVVKMPHRDVLGAGRVHGGAISALVDIAATAAFWSHPVVTASARGATVGFTINYLRLAVDADLTAIATVRRRGGSICTGDVSVVNDEGVEMATAVVTYKMNPEG